MLYETLYPIYRRSGVARRLRQARFERIVHALQLQPGERVLEVGCARGIDFAQFAVQRHVVTGVDIADVERVCQFDFLRADAAALPWADGHFDAVVSIGVLEHIQPIDQLCRVTTEIRRVARRFCVVVPAAGTWLEPHTWSLFWQARDRNRKAACAYELNYFSDEAWLQFPGFLGATTQRFWQAPGVQNLMICGAGLGGR